MVNTHGKFPVDARHNTYYEANGSDLRDATEEEIEKYKLAAAHKRRKPESSCDKSESATVVHDARKSEDNRASNTGEDWQRGHLSRDSDTERRRREKESKRDRDRTSSRGSKRGRDDDTQDRSRETAMRKSGTERSIGGQSAERDKNGQSNPDDVDEDERDRRKLAEIMPRMEKRKLTRASEVVQGALTEKVKPASRVDTNATKSKCKGGNTVKGDVKETVKTAEISEKTSGIRRDATDANTTQRDAAMQWASGEASNTNVVTQSTIGKNSVRQRGTKKANDKLSAIAMEDLQSLQAQNFIAGGYPPVEEGVSSTVRLGRALVSGALGRRTDDPKIFGVAVNLIKCSVKLQTTHNKAKTPVSAAPPNSIDSEAKGGAASNETTCDVQLSQSATDLGTQIELPGEDVETRAHEEDGIKDAGKKELGPYVTPVAAESSVPTLISYAGEESGGSDPRVRGNPEISSKKEVDAKTVRSPRNVLLAKFNRMMEEINVSTLVRKVLVRTEPHLASAASILSVVSGGASLKRTERNTNVTVERPSAVVCAGSANVKVDADVMVTEMIVGVGAAVPSGSSPWEIQCAERQRLTRIIAAKSLLSDELKKVNPSSFSLAAFRKAGYEEENKDLPRLGTGGETTDRAIGINVAASVEIIPSKMRAEDSMIIPIVDMRFGEVKAEMQQEIEISISEEEIMSIGDSEDGENGSDGFSDRSSSEGE